VNQPETDGVGIIIKSIDKPGTLVSSSDSRQFHSGYVVLESGKEIGEHETEGGEELIVVLEGTAEVSYGGRAESVCAPAVVLVPARTTHNVKNMSDGSLRYVYAYNMAMDES